MDDALKSRVLELLREGKSLRKVADATGVPKSTVQRIDVARRAAVEAVAVSTIAMRALGPAPEGAKFDVDLLDEALGHATLGVVDQIAECRRLQRDPDAPRMEKILAGRELRESFKAIAQVRRDAIAAGEHKQGEEIVEVVEYEEVAGPEHHEPPQVASGGAA